MATIRIDRTDVPRDGVTDAMGAIQRVIDAAPAGSRLIFERGMTYLVGRNPERPWNETHIQVPKKMHLDGNACRFLLGPEIHGSWAAVFRFDAPADLAGTWRQEIRQGERLLRVGPSLAGRLKLGQRVCLHLGECQFDTFDSGRWEGEDGMPDWSAIVRITAVGPDYIRISEGPPVDVRQGGVPHHLFVADSWPSGSVIENATFELPVNAENKSALAIRIQRADNVTVRNVAVVGNAVTAYWARGLVMDGLSIQTTRAANGIAQGCAGGFGDVQADVGRVEWLDGVCDQCFQQQPFILEGRCDVRIRSAAWARTGLPLRGHHVYAVAGNSRLRVDRHIFAGWDDHHLGYLEPNSPAVAELP